MNCLKIVSVFSVLALAAADVYVPSPCDSYPSDYAEGPGIPDVIKAFQDASEPIDQLPELPAVDIPDSKIQQPYPLPFPCPSVPIITKPVPLPVPLPVPCPRIPIPCAPVPPPCPTPYVPSSCGPAPRPESIGSLDAVILPIVESPVVELPSPPQPPATVVANTCTCTKTVLKPKLYQRVIQVQKNQRFLKKAYTPVVEKIAYSARPSC